MLRLRAERLKRGWTQAKVARATRLDQANYSRIDNGLATPYEGQLKRIARVLGWKRDPYLLLDEVPDEE